MFFPRFQYHMLYVLYPFATYLPTVPRISTSDSKQNLPTIDLVVDTGIFFPKIATVDPVLCLIHIIHCYKLWS
jgi:hypothetical protein